MKKINLFFVFFLFAGSVFAQDPYSPIPLWSWGEEKILDHSILRVEYTMSFFGASGKNEICTDKRMVEIGENVIKDYSAILEEKEQENYRVAKKGGSPSTGLSMDVYPIELFCFKEGSIRINQRTLMTGPILQYTQSRPDFRWKLQEGQMQVETYLCQKATVSYGGREWVAWYTEDIPVGSGPYKFGGLPGLILQIASQDGSYKWQMTGIDSKKVPIFEKQFMFKKCTSEEARKLVEDMYKHPFKFMRTAGIRTLVKDKNGNLVRPGDNEEALSLFYDPIEKE